MKKWKINPFEFEGGYGTTALLNIVYTNSVNYTVDTIQTALHFLISSIYAYIHCSGRLECYWNGLMGSEKNVGLEWVTGEYSLECITKGAFQKLLSGFHKNEPKRAKISVFDQKNMFLAEFFLNGKFCHKIPLY